MFSNSYCKYFQYVQEGSRKYEDDEEICEIHKTPKWNLYKEITIAEMKNTLYEINRGGMVGEKQSEIKYSNSRNYQK